MTSTTLDLFGFDGDGACSGVTAGLYFSSAAIGVDNKLTKSGRNATLSIIRSGRKVPYRKSEIKQDSLLEVTVLRRPGTLESESEVDRSEGFQLIRVRIFDKILEAEKKPNRPMR